MFSLKKLPDVLEDLPSRDEELESLAITTHEVHNVAGLL